MSDTKKKAGGRSKSTTGINFEANVLAYLDDLRTESPVFRRRSRSEVVNMIIEDYAARNGVHMNEDTEEPQRQTA